MPFDRPGAQRAPLHQPLSRPGIRRTAIVALALLIGGGIAASVPATNLAAEPAPSPVVDGPSTTSPLTALPLSPTSSVALSDVTTGTVTTTASTVPEPTEVPDPGTSTAPPRPKVVVVVGPVGGKTREYIRSARRLAASARAYGATVVELYSPNATWARVSKAADGANVLIYLGHGNGWPTGYGPFNPKTKDGLGLNARAGAGNSNTRYYGEALIARSIDFAENAVVILNRLCYASGNNEWGRGNPSRSTAMKRVDNYGAGFLKAGAAAVFAEGITDARYILRGLFKTDRTLEEIFWSSSKATGRYDFAFTSKRTAGASAILDPYARSRYYRSVVGSLDVSATDWRLGDAVEPAQPGQQ